MSRNKTKKTADSFNYHYLPGPVAVCFRDAMGCYRDGLQQSFAAMCRLTAQTMFEDLGEGAKLRIYDQVEEIANLANIDDNVYRNIRNILFENDSDSLVFPGGIDRETTAILLETMKEILYQEYIRRALLREKLRMRRFFAGHSELYDADEVAANISPINRPTGTNDG